MILLMAVISRAFFWRTISVNQLADVFQGAEDEAASVYRGPAQPIRWCLRSSVGRPSLKQILAHPLLQEGGPSSLLPVELPMRYTFFISHSQGDAASTAKSVYSACKTLGVECWWPLNP